jgi:type III restriction enzyme
MEHNPILNSPYLEPTLHYATVATGSEKGSLDYTRIVEGRRIFDPEIQGQSAPTKKKSNQGDIFELNDMASVYGTHLINLLRKEVGKWRKGLSSWETHYEF